MASGEKRNIPYTREELERIKQLRDEGVKWVQIAERLDRPVDAMKAMLWRYRRGRVHFRAAVQKRRAQMESLIRQGASTKDMAKACGLQVQTIRVWLSRNGWDLQLREMYRDPAHPARFPAPGKPLERRRDAKGRFLPVSPEEPLQRRPEPSQGTGEAS
jgi:DNA-binding transcriptional MerR regulator